MARSRAVARGLRIAPVWPIVAAALLGSVGWGWYVGGRPTAGTTVRATVVETIDGDTVVVEFANGTRDTVRLLGVDTPETHHPTKPVQCYGPEASDYTRARLLGKIVTLERDAEVRDKYGRFLAYVILDGALYNDELLREGYARFLVIPPNGAHARAMLADELAAQQAHRGLWGAC
jgi:micrococcal nuclease